MKVGRYPVVVRAALVAACVWGAGANPCWAQGACCIAGGFCADNVQAGDCPGTFHDGVSCGEVACPDCNSNGVPDSLDIAAGAADVNGDGIPDECQSGPVCGNNVTEAGEDCDGTDSGICADGCEPDCTCTPFCGDGIVNQSSETCDGSDLGSTLCTTCRSSGTDPCTCCGDGIRQAATGEDCDGTDSGICGDGCELNCTCTPVCGDSSANQSSETCDGTDAGTSGCTAVGSALPNECRDSTDPDAPCTCCGDTICDSGENQCNCSQDCGSPPATEKGLCTDGIDNDCRGGIDCADGNCRSDPACTEKCANGVDDDGDGLVDCDDQDCKGAPACRERCANNKDDDGDGDTDCDDSDCAGVPPCP